MTVIYIVVEYDFDGIAFCSHMFREKDRALLEFRKIFQYGGEAQIRSMEFEISPI